jgi:broad specificity phosphatase PhoE
VQGLYQGRTDVDLNDVGREQAEQLARRLSSERIDGVYSSDLKRAMQTAGPIARAHGMAVTPRKELRELNVGELEGKHPEDIEREYGPLEGMWQDGEWSAPGGETLGQFNARVAGFVEGLKSQQEEGTFVVVAHGGSLRSLISGFLGIDPPDWWRISLDGASLSILDLHPERAVLALMNDTCHLTD